MLSKLYDYATWALAIVAGMLLIVLILMFVPMNYKRAHADYDYSYAKQLYATVRVVPQSQDNMPQLNRIIDNRLACYAEASDLQERISECIPIYTTALVAFARDNVHSNPLLGRFISESEACPVMYSICRGAENLSEEQCKAREAQCIEYMLDKYWRGSNNLKFFK